MPTKKDLDALRGAVGEAFVAYELMARGWEVMTHLGGQGYDLLATKGPTTIRVEVKTTDPRLRGGPRWWQLTKSLSQSEAREADFFVYYVHGCDAFFIIPKSDFPKSRSITVNAKRSDPSRRTLAKGSKYQKYLNNWDALDPQSVSPAVVTP